MNRQVAVTGLGLVTSFGCNVQEVWQKMLNGQSGISTLAEPVRIRGGEIKTAGIIPDFRLENLAPEIAGQKDLMKTAARATQFALLASLRAAQDAKLPLFDNLRINPEIINVNRAATSISLSLGDGPKFCEYYDKFGMDSTRLGMFSVPQIMPNAPVGHVAMMLGAKGQSQCVVTACASGTDAIGSAFRLIKHGYADVVICGGTDDLAHAFYLSCFGNMMALSKLGVSRPFDKNRDGFVMGEGAGILVLEELEQARARGTKAYCLIAGYGATCDAYHITAPQPEAEGGVRALTAAMLEAGESEIDYYNAHGTSTPLNDKIETMLKKALGENQAQRIAINSTKSMLGHTIGAAGAIEAAVCCLTINTGWIHPTINLTTPDPDCDLDYCSSGKRRNNIAVAASMSLGFGGHNGCLVFTAPP